MAQIYKISNDINNKVYIGKTTFTIKKRWGEHKHDLYIRDKHNRPLYKAMLKYGIEHFHIEVLEECSREELNDREQYWIKEYNSFHNGYNATRGGDGKLYVDERPIIDLWDSGYPIRQIVMALKVDKATIQHILLNKGITHDDIARRKMIRVKRKVCQCAIPTGEILHSYDSIYEASLEVTGSVAGNTHIAACCKGKRKSAYGFSWKYQ